MTEHVDVLIVGGGVIGLTTAYYLAGEGVAVAVLDQGDLGRQASWAGAGIISPSNLALARDPFELLRAHSNLIYPDLSRRLLETTGIDNGYRVCGGLELEDNEEEWAGEGVRRDLLDRKGIEAVDPHLALHVERAYHLPDMAQVRNPRHLRALITGCQQRGVRLRPGCSAHAFDHSGARVTALESDDGPMTAGRYLLAAGAWADGLLASLGWRLGVVPVRGQIALLNAPPTLLRSILLQGKRYLVPRGDGHVLVGSTEEDAGFVARTTAAGIEGLLTLARSLVPALADAELERGWAGLRPGSPDGLPFLGPVPGFDNVFVAGGHFRAGLQLSPATGLVMSQVLLGHPPLVPLGAFRLGRPGA